MIKPFLEIKFDNNNSDLRLLISRRSFVDTSEKIAKELLKKIAKISEQIEAKNIELSKGDNDDINLLVEINNMLKIKREISEKLGRIVLR